MISADILNLLFWWLTLFSIGLLALPLTLFFFKNFWDLGYSFSKIIGLLLLSYFLLLIPSFKILPFNSTLIILTLILFTMLNLFILKKQNYFSLIKNNYKSIVFQELFFFFAFLIWSYIRSFEPSIHGLEKFMDFGFINSILRSDYFPPLDLWLPPNFINYYYFGHLVTAVLIKLSGVPAFIGYNLMVATLFAFTLTCSFSLASNFSNLRGLTKRYLILSGIIGSFLVTLGGNLHTIYAFFQGYNGEEPVPFWKLIFNLNLDSYWYPNATRFIPKTIHEFPLYSFVVSDLHGHVLNIPFVLLLLSFLIKVLFSKLEDDILTYALFGFFIAIFLMTNILDGPIYLLLIVLSLAVKYSYLNFQKVTVNKFVIQRMSKIFLFVALFAITFSLPFWLDFKPFGSGIGVLCAPNFLTSLGHLGPFLFEGNHCQRSPLWMLFILWGFHLVLTSVFIFKTKKINEGWLTSEKIVYLLAGFSFLLILIPEFFYVKDIYPAHYRANTVFKFGYQAFIILGLLSGYMLSKLVSLKKLRLLSGLVIWYLFIFILIYPYFAINSYYGNLKESQGLHGLKYLATTYPEDYLAILWLQNHVLGQPIILEAEGDSYTDFARISSNTGLPTVVGWPVHEWLWRGNPNEAYKRADDVKVLYESDDINLTEKLIEQYKIEYIFIGVLEKQKYPKLNENKFSNLGRLVYSYGNTKIYELTRSR